MKQGKPDNIEIVELIVIKPGKSFNRLFIGEMKRIKTVDGKALCFGNLTMSTGQICSQGISREELYNNLDGICNLRLYRKLHKTQGRSIIVLNNKLYLN